MAPALSNSPFASSVTAPGRGEVVLQILPPSVPSLTTCSYKYPLKLISRVPAVTLKSSYPESATTPVHLYLLTYGGGLLPGDHIDVSISLRPRSRLVVTTPQGSTKIYKTRRKSENLVDNDLSGTGNPLLPEKSYQILDVEIGKQAGLCYLPDPSTPFEHSRYEQIQRFTLLKDGVADPHERPSLCVLDWVTEGRTARGENWSFNSWRNKNEVYAQSGPLAKRKLLLRDSVILDDEHAPVDSVHLNGTSTTPPSNTELSIQARTHPHGIVGTLILYGPLFDTLATFFMEQFTSQPRIGGRNWSSATPSVTSTTTATNTDKPKQNTVTWTAARVRSDFVLVKFGARDFESARDWLGDMFRREGSIEREFGNEALGGF